MHETWPGVVHVPQRMFTTNTETIGFNIFDIALLTNFETKI